MEVTAEELAQFFHETYEELAPDFGYTTRKSSAVPWERVPEPNKSLMIAVAQRILQNWRKESERDDTGSDRPAA